METKRLSTDLGPRAGRGYSHGAPESVLGVGKVPLMSQSHWGPYQRSGRREKKEKGLSGEREEKFMKPWRPYTLSSCYSASDHRLGTREALLHH